MKLQITFTQDRQTMDSTLIQVDELRDEGLIRSESRHSNTLRVCDGPEGRASWYAKEIKQALEMHFTTHPVP